MGRLHAHAFPAQSRLWRTSVAEPGQRGKRPHARSGVRQPVRLRRAWRAIYSGVAFAGTDRRTDRPVSTQGTASGAEIRPRQADRAVPPVNSGGPSWKAPSITVAARPGQDDAVVSNRQSRRQRQRASHVDMAGPCCGLGGRFDRQAMLSMMTLPRLTRCRSPSRGRSMTASLTQIY